MLYYYISGVFKDPQNRIQEVLIHSTTQDGSQIQQGQRVTETTVINLLDAGHNISTMRWDYNQGRYVLGARVIAVSESPYKRSLRTVPNSLHYDNLDNMLNMWNLGYK